MTRARLKLVICPSCKGTGKSPCLGWTCAWCIGLRRVPVETALQYADQVETLGQGGYICGDHDVADMRRMEAEGMAIRKLIADFGGVA